MDDIDQLVEDIHVIRATIFKHKMARKYTRDFVWRTYANFVEQWNRNDFAFPTATRRQIECLRAAAHVHDTNLQWFNDNFPGENDDSSNLANNVTGDTGFWTGSVAGQPR